MAQLTDKEIIDYLLLEIAKKISLKENLLELNNLDHENIAKEVSNKTDGQNLTYKSIKNWVNGTTPNAYNLNRLAFFVLKSREEEGLLNNPEHTELLSLIGEVTAQEIGNKVFFYEFKKIIISNSDGQEKYEAGKETINEESKGITYKRFLPFFCLLGLLLLFFCWKSCRPTPTQSSTSAPNKKNPYHKFAATWKGTLIQDSLSYKKIESINLPKEIAVIDLPKNITLTLDTIDVGLAGLLIFEDIHDDIQFDSFDVIGNIIPSMDYILKIDYKCIRQNDCKPFGTILLEINDYTSKMHGGLVGYGARNKTIVRGEIELTKKGS